MMTMMIMIRREKDDIERPGSGCGGVDLLGGGTKDLLKKRKKISKTGFVGYTSASFFDTTFFVL